MSEPGPATMRHTVARLLSRWAHRLHATNELSGISEAELRTLIAVNSGTGHVREVMVPRTEVLFLDAGLTVAEAVAEVRVTRHSRFPVIDGDQDDVLGFVHVRDLTLLPVVDPRLRLRELTREVKRLPASKRSSPRCPRCAARGTTWRSSWTSTAAPPASSPSRT